MTLPSYALTSTTCLLTPPTSVLTPPTFIITLPTVVGLRPDLCTESAHFIVLLNCLWLYPLVYQLLPLLNQNITFCSIYSQMWDILISSKQRTVHLYFVMTIYDASCLPTWGVIKINCDFEFQWCFHYLKIKVVRSIVQFVDANTEKNRWSSHN